MKKIMAELKSRIGPIIKPVIVFYDVCALLCALGLAFWLRFDTTPYQDVLQDYVAPHIYDIPVIVCVFTVLYAIFRLYRYAWRFSSLEVLWSIICANSIGIMVMVVLQVALHGQTFPRSVIAMFWILNMMTTAISRICLRLVSTWGSSDSDLAIQTRHSRPKQILILGAGDQGARTIRAIRENDSLNYNVVGFLDDDLMKLNTYIANAPVLGVVGSLFRQIEKHNIDEVVVALPLSSGEKIRRYVLECRKRGVQLKVIHNLADQLHGRSRLKVDDYTVEDLLRRPTRASNIKEFGQYLTGRRVLVTGAGGSIGSELCRQIIKLKPAEIILFGHGENSIFQIQQELVRDHPDMACRISPAIGCISNVTRINRLFSKYKPHIVFNAAAHKHVPLMETNILEAVHNNVIGTYNIVSACRRYNVMKMVQISTDKVAEPHSVMGATKWLCEAIVRAGASYESNTDFIAVRFGNVLGSRGSVVPIFKAQIASGGPVTVTDQNMTRYFMTIPEAATLVLHSGAVGSSGCLYLLDMGAPVKIADLAEDMIRLSGYEPGVDIDIEYTGVRPGEKLHEQLASPAEKIGKSEWEGLTIVQRPEYLTAADVSALIGRLKGLIDDGDEDAMFNLLETLIPGFADRPVRARTPKGIKHVASELTAGRN